MSAPYFASHKICRTRSHADDRYGDTCTGVSRTDSILRASRRASCLTESNSSSMHVTSFDKRFHFIRRLQPACRAASLIDVSTPTPVTTSQPWSVSVDSQSHEYSSTGTSSWLILMTSEDSPS